MKMVKWMAALMVAAGMLTTQAKTAKVGSLTWSYRVNNGWFDDSAGEDGEFVDEQVAVVTGVKGAKGKLSIPAKLGGYPVRFIGPYAFEENLAITSVVIPQGVVEIGEYAFEECEKLKAVTFPEGLRRIGFDAFCGCRSLGNVSIPSTVEDGIAFLFCYGMKSITVAEDNPWFKSVDGVVYSKDGTSLVYFPPGRTGEWAVPETVTEIADEAFGGGLLSALDIHAGVKSIGLGGTFVECLRLTRISVDEGNEWYKDVDGVLFSKDGTLLVAYPAGKKDVKVYTVPQTVTQLGDDVFSGCAFTGVILAATLSHLSCETFEACEKLTSVILGTGLETIDSKAFFYAPKITALTLPAGVQRIEDWAFEDADRLKTLYFPAGAERGPRAFSDCPAKRIAYSSARLVTFDLNYEEVGEYRYDRNVVNGQPVGILPTPAREDYGFAGWFTAPVGGTKITSATKITKDATFYAHWARKIDLQIDGRGTVAGGTVHVAGSKVTLTATPAKGYVFVCWDLGFAPMADESLWQKYRQPKISFTMPDESFPIWALFKKKSEDPAPMITVSPSIWYVAEDEECVIGIDSSTAMQMSYPILKATGLPRGITLKKKTTGEYFYGADNEYILRRTGTTKPGVYAVKLTATNRSGKKATKTVKVVTPNAHGAVDAGALSLDTDVPYELSAGLKFTDAAWGELGIFAEEGWKMTTVTGVPGLTWNAKKQVFTGVPSKAGVYCVTFTVVKGKQKKTATATFVVKALPASIVGTFTGHVLCDYEDVYDEEEEAWILKPCFGKKARKATITVASSGKVSAKIGSKSLATTGLTIDENGLYHVYAQTAKKYSTYTDVNQIDLTLDADTESAKDVLQGTYGYGRVTPRTGALGEGKIVVQKGGSDLDAETLARAKAAGKRGMIVFKVFQREDGRDYDYELQCPECVENPRAYKQTLFAKADANGKVTLTGTIAGKKVSGTAWLRQSGLEDGEHPVAYFFSGGFAIKILYYFDEYYENVLGEAWRQ